MNWGARATPRPRDSTTRRRMMQPPSFRKRKTLCAETRSSSRGGEESVAPEPSAGGSLTGHAGSTTITARSRAPTAGIPMSRWKTLVVLALSLLPLGLARPVMAGDADHLVIPPGRDVEISALFKGPPIEGCSWDGANPDRGTIHVKYACRDGQRLLLDLTPAIEATPETPRSSAFAVRIASGSPPKAFLAAFLDQLRERDTAWQWMPASQGVSEPPPPTIATAAAEKMGLSQRDPVPVCCAVLAGALVILLLLSLNPRSRAAPRPQPPQTSERLVGFGAMIAAAAVMLHAVLTPRVDEESLVTLGRAAEQPWHRDGGLRFISVDVFHWFVVAIGASPRQIAAINALTVLIAGACLWRILCRLGWASSISRTAACLWLATGAVHYISSVSIGFQIVGGLVALFGSVLAADASLDGKAPKRVRIARAGVAITLAALGVWIKLVLVALAVPTVVVVALREGRRWRSRALMMAGAQGLAFIVSQGRAADQSDLAKVGMSGVLRNAAKIMELASPAWALLVVSILLALFARRSSGREHSPSPPLRRSMTMLIVGALWTAPFLLNARYCMEHYSILAVIPLLVHAAWALHSAARRSLVHAFPALVFIAAFALRAPRGHVDADAALSGFLGELSHASADMPPPSRVFVVVDCREPQDLPETERRFQALVKVDSLAYRWVTGWRGVPIALIHAPSRPSVRWPGERTAHYCFNRPLRWDGPHTPPG
ncbi:Hypothetical protein A7982_07120 [Minicystis rosea]|nr:Hypothetical protein A7982_07120 [Minicystis rosea]